MLSAFPLGGAFLSAFFTAFARARFTALLAPATAAFLSAFIRLVYGGPGTTFRFFLAGPALLVTLFDMLCFSFLFRCVFLFASSCHGLASIFFTNLAGRLVLAHSTRCKYARDRRIERNNYCGGTAPCRSGAFFRRGAVRGARLCPGLSTSAGEPRYL